MSDRDVLCEYNQKHATKDERDAFERRGFSRCCGAPRYVMSGNCTNCGRQQRDRATTHARCTATRCRIGSTVGRPCPKDRS